MTSEIEPYRPRAAQVDLNRTATDDWFEAFGSIVKLSEYISETDFVPDAMRRKPAAVAAAILSGREMGIPPMTALRHIHVIKGKPGQSAELMRAQSMRAGHEIRYIEMTDTRCIVEGRRRDESNWTRVTFSVADAKTAKIDLGGYPADKLLARATSRLCRRLFPDAISGLPTIDELEDNVEVFDRPNVVRIDSERAADEPVRAVEATTTTQRKRQPRKQAAAQTEAPATPAESPDEPDLPGDEPSTTTVKDETHIVTANDAGEPLCSRPQQTKLAILLDNEKVGTRQEKLDYLENQFGRTFTSSKDLTLAEASSLIRFLEDAQKQDAEQPTLDGDQ